MKIGGSMNSGKKVKSLNIKKIEVAKPKVPAGGCAPSADPDAPPC